jgi:hypothetical protein
MQEEKILSDIIAINLDACSFYREAAEKAALPVAENVFHDLEKIHSSVVEGLGLAAYQGGHSALMKLDSGADLPAALRHLGGPDRIDVDCRLIDAVESVEDRCIRSLTEAIHSEEVSSDIKMHVMEAADMLNLRHAHIHRLKDLAFVSDMKH